MSNRYANKNELKKGILFRWLYGDRFSWFCHEIQVSGDDKLKLSLSRYLFALMCLGNFVVVGDELNIASKNLEVAERKYFLCTKNEVFH